MLEIPDITQLRRRRLLDLDPDLLPDASQHDFELMRDAISVPCMTFPPGLWDPSAVSPHAYFGILLASGQMMVSVGIGPRTHHELIGTGDVGQPWVAGDPGASLGTETEWCILRETEVALLDRRFAVEAARWPMVMRSLMERLVVRSRRLLFQLAVLSLPQVTARIELLLWHFADRWGCATRDGVVLDLPVTHEVLAEIVGARRPSVTTALRDLRLAGRVERRSDGRWLLCGDAPRDLATLYEQAALAPKLTALGG